MNGIYASLRQALVLILQRRINPRNTQCIPMVNLKRIAFLDLEQISADFRLKRFETGSIAINF